MSPRHSLKLEGVPCWQLESKMSIEQFSSNDLFNSMQHSPAFLSNNNTNWGYIQEPKNLQCNAELATPRPACTAVSESNMDFGNLSFRDQSTVALPSCSKTSPFLSPSYFIHLVSCSHWRHWDFEGRCLRALAHISWRVLKEYRA